MISNLRLIFSVTFSLHSILIWKCIYYLPFFLSLSLSGPYHDRRYCTGSLTAIVQIFVANWSKLDWQAHENGYLFHFAMMWIWNQCVWCRFESLFDDRVLISAQIIREKKTNALTQRDRYKHFNRRNWTWNESCWQKGNVMLWWSTTEKWKHHP